jgi:hypothetical protein
MGGAYIVPKGPWTTSLNWKTLATPYRETRSTFHQHVQSGDDISGSSFPQFIRLPVELQRHTLRFCDGATLFALMHASSTTRDEARKLFWSDPDTRYLVEGGWLLRGGFIGYTHDDVEALACMTHIEVDCSEVDLPRHLVSYEDKRPWHRIQPTDEDMQQGVERFWSTLCQVFPRAVDIVLSEDIPFDTAAPVPFGLVSLAKGCPVKIRVSLSALQRDANHYVRVTRRRWQGASNAWKIVDLEWARQSVLPPPKIFRGPVGAFHYIDYSWELECYLHFARQLLVIQATEAYYQQAGRGPCVCPAPGCGLRFELPGQWAVHVVDANGHQDDLPPPPCQALQAQFKNHFARLDGLKQQRADMLEKLRQEWGEDGSQQRSNATEAFLYQLQYDPLWAQRCSPIESDIWCRYQREMNDEECVGC